VFIYSVASAFFTVDMVSSFSSFDPDSPGAGPFADFSIYQFLILWVGGLFTSVLSLGAGISFVIWYNTAHDNVLSFSNMKIDKSMAIAIWIVPIVLAGIPLIGTIILLVALFFQYQIMKDLLEKSAASRRDTSQDNALLKFWVVAWGLAKILPSLASLFFIFSFFKQGIDLVNSENLDSQEDIFFDFDFTGLTTLTIIAAIFGILSIIPIVKLIKNISQDQDARLLENPQMPAMQQQNPPQNYPPQFGG